MRKSLLIICILALLSVATFADDIVLSRSTDKTGFSIVSDQMLQRFGSKLTLKCHIAKMVANVVDTEKGKFTSLSIPGFQSSSVVGDPNVPMMNRLIEVPFGGDVTVKVNYSSEQEYDLKALGYTFPVIPRQPSLPKDGSTSKFVYNENAYKVNGYKRSELSEVQEVGVLRSMRLVLLKVSPVQYNPVENKMKVYNDIEIEISLNNVDIARTAEIYKSCESPYFSWVRERLLSPESLATLRGNDLTKYPVTYVIVADRKFEADLERFITWKKEKGFKVITAYTDTIGSSVDKIDNYLYNLYQSENPKPTFILFVGDVAEVPAKDVGAHVTDLYYADVTGDNIPDMYYGRFSASNSTDLNVQIDKTMEYEKYEFADPSFLSRAVMIAGWDYSHAVEWGWPQINYGINNYYNSNYGINTVSKFLSAGSHQNESSIKSKIAAGACYVNYTAHGSSYSWADPSMSISDVEGFGNKGMYPLVVGNCCLTNTFEKGKCFGEAWLRAKDSGAIGYIGGSNSTYWDEDLWWGNGHYSIKHPNSNGDAPNKADTGDGAYDCGFTKGYFSNYAFIMAGNLAVEESSSSRKKYYWEVYHIMGDPSLMVYWGVPSSMNVNVADKGNKVIGITAEDGAYIGITKNGELKKAKLLSGASTQITVTESGTYKVVVTKKNRIPHIQEITVR